MAQRTVDSRWTPREDELLTRAVANFGEHDNWKTVAQAVPGRTNKACRKVHFSSFNPLFLTRENICTAALAPFAFTRGQKVRLDPLRGPALN